MDLDDEELLYTRIHRKYIKKEIVKRDYIKKDKIRDILKKYEKRPLEDGVYFYKEIKKILGE